MLSKIIIGFFLFFFSTQAYAHDFDTEAMTYILSHNEATWTDFESHMLSIDSWEFTENVERTEFKLSTALSLPGKKYVVNYAKANPEFSYSEIQNLIQDDPMLSEIWAEAIYSFLHTKLQQGYTISFDFLIQFIRVGIEHILSWIDHILFLVTLIICLPKMRRIFILITTFTIAHSITIILGWLQLVSIPSVITESMILISIMIMAIYAMFQKIGTEKSVFIETILIFILWLFHGLWFAGFFRGVLDVSENIFFPIFSFNIWVELGQTLILVLGILFLHSLYRFFPKQKEHIKNTLAVFCIMIALMMLVMMFF